LTPYLVVALLKYYGADVREKPGAITFLLDGGKFSAHPPHARKECGRGLVTRVRDFLRNCGRI